MVVVVLQVPGSRGAEKTDVNNYDVVERRQI